MYLCMYVCMQRTSRSIAKWEKRCGPSKVKKLGKNAAAYAPACIARKKIKTQNPRLMNESGFKSRAAYDGAGTVF